VNKKLVFSCILLALLIIGAHRSDIAVGNQTALSDTNSMIPYVSTPADVVYFFGEIGNNIIWEIADDNPSFWIVLRDSNLVEIESWIDLNETVTVNVDSLDIGVHEYEILACTSDYNISDSVLVTVLYSDLTPHAPFSISSNSQWASFALSESWRGNGTESNPYIIEGYIFDVTTIGIGIYHTTAYFIIQNCTFVSAGIDYSIGIDLQSVMNGEIVNCTFTKLWVGVIVWSSENISWESNLFSSLSYGIRLQDSIDCRVTWNNFYSGGLSISGYQLVNWIHDINNNQVNEKPLGYFNGLSGNYIDGYDFGQILLANSTNSWIEGGNFENVGDAVQIGHSYSCKIEVTEMNHCSRAIFTERSNNTYIFACVVRDCMEFGIHINESANCVVMNCNVSNINCLGIIVLKSYNTSLLGNYVTNCGDTAIALYESEDSVACYNTVTQNRGVGIGIGDCSYSFIMGNRVKYNTDIGIMISWGSYCTIYQNEIGFNEAGNAYDDGSSNSWDNGINTGNKWSDYNGSGYYYIDGLAGSVDHYPGVLGIDEAPTIDHPPDLTYIVGTTGHYITWTAHSFNPSFYVIYKNDDVYIFYLWSNLYINVNVDGLAIGSYIFSIIVVDAFGQNATDTVVVNVLPETPIIVTNATTTTTTTSSSANGTTDIGIIQQLTMMISIGSVGVIIIVAVLVIRSMKGTG